MPSALHQPDSLNQICLDFCVENLEDVLCTVDEDTGYYRLRKDIVLPLAITEGLIDARVSEGGALDDKFLNIFGDVERTRLRKLNLTNSEVTDDVFGLLCQHSLHELCLTGCRQLSSECIKHINKTASSLQVLHIGDSEQLLSSGDFKEHLVRICSNQRPPGRKPVYGRDFIFNAPNLKVFSLNNLRTDGIHDLLATLLNPFGKLQHLDLSTCGISVAFTHCLVDFAPTLKSLVLHDIILENLSNAFQRISKLKELRHLDISVDPFHTHDYVDPGQELKRLVILLPNLVSLDISGTNLAGTGMESSTPDDRGDRAHPCSIPALEGRHFEFLGLVKCRDNACYRNNIPADRVTGDANEKQVLCSVTSYLDKPGLLLIGLENAFQLFRTESVQDLEPMRLALVAAMERHPFNKNVQVSASASLFFIAKREDDVKHKFDVKFTRRMIRCTLNAMDRHMQERTIVRNACLTLCQFEFPEDIRFVYCRMVRLLLEIVNQQDQEEFVQRIGAYLLNSLACQVNGEEKQLIGDMNGITVMLKIICNRLDNELCDEVMTIAWSALWNVTDETAMNCERFINMDGMQLFLRCLETFPEKDELRRNMMGLMGNVAEVKYLRPRLMRSEFVTEFSNLLKSTNDGIEVSYNAAGVLAHMLCDGVEAWTVDVPDRRLILQLLEEAIDRWDLSASRNINYRSFQPILKLAACYSVPEAQHWAVWALCNLTKVYPDKYCPLVHRQKGIDLLQELVANPGVREKVKLLARTVIEEYGRYKDRQECTHDGPCDVEME